MAARRRVTIFTMRRAPSLALALLTAAVLTATVRGQFIRDPKLYRSGVELTSINATVRDAEGHLVTGLSRESFEIFEDGERQTIAQFSSERVPISLGVLLDTSDSMFGRRIKDARATVERFLFDLLSPDDEYFVMAFNHRPRLLTSWTSTPSVVREMLDGVKPLGGTAAYDAVISALPMFNRRSRERAALVIISDGADTASDASLRDVHSALTRTDVFVYAIAIDSPERQPINTRVNPTALREITDDSGGRTEIVHSGDELAAAAAGIAEELNQQYLMAYSSSHSGDGRYHSLRVRVPGTDYKVRARNSFVATPGRRDP
jgi:Ca-activated chloride channel family protein